MLADGRDGANSNFSQFSIRLKRVVSPVLKHPSMKEGGEGDSTTHSEFRH
jgi:hypothetical protein